MSVESAKMFVSKMMTDKEFEQKFQKLNKPDLCMAFVQGAGFDFTLDEYQEAMRSFPHNEYRNVCMQMYYLMLRGALKPSDL